MQATAPESNYSVRELEALSDHYELTRLDKARLVGIAGRAGSGNCFAFRRTHYAS